jgi:DNA-binding IclR family transcriptional regulator
MEKNEISSHEVLVYRELAKGEWITSKAIAEAAGVAPRTARAHALKLVRLGIVDQAEVFPAHRYRLSTHAAKRNRGYADRITRAAEVLGIPLA